MILRCALIDCEGEGVKLGEGEGAKIDEGEKAKLGEGCLKVRSG